MSRKYPRPIPHYRPISQKAYDTFVRQIFAVVPMDNRCADMVEALDKYLAGDRDTYASHLDEHTAITFDMLRFEIDKAIQRSARARRPRRRKVEAVSPVPEVTTQAKEETPVRKKKCPKDAKKPLSDNETLSPDPIKEIFTSLISPLPTEKESVTETQDNPSVKDSSTDDAESPVPPLLPRRIRRAAMFASRPRHKWRKIG
ncbi:MAG: hypothetical protein K2K77_00945 [Duncaniella sp.]|nr:hypothetical protein [Duncaniella sp.]